MPAFPAAEARHAPTSIRPDLCCIEIDQAATQSAKRTAAGSGIGFIAADLAREELGALLAGHPGCSRKWRRPRRAAG
jgi:hypothetical protein